MASARVLSYASLAVCLTAFFLGSLATTNAEATCSSLYNPDVQWQPEPDIATLLRSAIELSNDITPPCLPALLSVFSCENDIQKVSGCCSSRCSLALSQVQRTCAETVMCTGNTQPDFKPFTRYVVNALERCNSALGDLTCADIALPPGYNGTDSPPEVPSPPGGGWGPGTPPGYGGYGSSPPEYYAPPPVYGRRRMAENYRRMAA